MPVKNILILHGWESNPREHWYQKAKEKFENDGYKVFTPEMPGAYFPKKEEWLKIIESYHPDKEWVLIGHSLGGVAILKYLENANTQVSKTILIATPNDAMHFGALEHFFGDGFDFRKIKKNCPKFDLIYEDNDPAVPLEHGKKFAKDLGCKIHIVKGYVHMGKIDLKLLEKLIEK